MHKLENKGHRCYFVNIMYLLSGQTGIQAQHASTRLMLKYWNLDNQEEYLGPNKKVDIVKEWADKHETSIVLNGGMHGDLVELHNWLCQNQNEISVPFASFEESEYALNDVMTSIAIVLPQWIWGATPYELIDNLLVESTEKWLIPEEFREEHGMYLNEHDAELKTRLSKMRLFNI